MNKATFGSICLVLGLILGILYQCKWDNGSGSNPDMKFSTAQVTQSRPIDPVTVVSSAEEATIQLFERSAPSVVFITTTAQQQDYWSRNIYEIPAGTGSGFIWDENGHVVTNYHVIQNAYKAKRSEERRVGKECRTRESANQ